MKKLLSTAALSLLLISGLSSAACIGTNALSTCTDSSGNTYNVQRIGGTTNVQGSNSGTGSTWSQTSTTYGNTTLHNGVSSDGNSWNGTTHKIGNSRINSGTDSRGNSYYNTCIGIHCD